MALLLAAGCLGGSGPGSPAPPTSSSTTPGPPPEPAPFDGEAALGFVRALALKEDGTPRFRMPGTEGQREGAAILWDLLDVPGWSRHWHNFTGADYMALDLDVVASYGPGTAYCPAQDLERLPEWPFHDLYAILPGSLPGAPLLMLGAHWDSQMHSRNDANASRRDWPDPGANDGASGVGLLLELMRQLAGMPRLPFDVGVILLDGEDGFYDCYPLAGSLHFAQHPPVDVGRFILLDMVGDPDARFVRETKSMQSDPALMDAIWRAAHARGGDAAATHFTAKSATIVDDHLAFIQAGVPSVDVIDAGRDRTFPPQWDTTEDTVDKLSPGMLALVGDALLWTLVDPVLTGPWPVPPPSPAP